MKNQWNRCSASENKVLRETVSITVSEIHWNTRLFRTQAFWEIP